MSDNFVNFDRILWLLHNVSPQLKLTPVMVAQYLSYSPHTTLRLKTDSWQQRHAAKRLYNLGRNYA